MSYDMTHTLKDSHKIEFWKWHFQGIEPTFESNWEYYDVLTSASIIFIPFLAESRAHSV